MQEEVYNKPEDTIVKPKKSHKKLIILSVISIIAICLILVYYFIYKSQSDLAMTREELMTHMDGWINSIENTSSTYYTESKVSYALENPRNFNSSDLIKYTGVSDSYSMKNSFVILKGIFENQFSKGFNDVDGISAPTYLTVLITSMALSYTAESNFITTCENQVNFTEDDKKGCIISVLDAKKNVLDRYYSLDYSGNVENCVSTLKKDDNHSINIIGGKEYVALGDSKLNQICQNMIGYREQLLEEVKNASIDYSQKYFIVSSLNLQDLYIGSGNVSLNGILKEGMKDSVYLKIFP